MMLLFCLRNDLLASVILRLLTVHMLNELHVVCWVNPICTGITMSTYSVSRVLPMGWY